MGNGKNKTEANLPTIGRKCILRMSSLSVMEYDVQSDMISGEPLACTALYLKL